MSTSKIGRTIKTRDVVTPGYSNSKKKQSFESLKEELSDVKKLYNTLLQKYQQQENNINNFNEKLRYIELSRDKKVKDLELIQKELRDKNSHLQEVSQKLSNLEDKVSRLEDICEDLISQLSSPKKKEAGWKLFKGSSNGG